MGFCCSIGALLSCPMGLTPTPLTVIPKNLFGPTGPMATCLDCVPFLNIAPFGVCKSLLNPSTAALTAAAFGVLTPGPCIPTPTGPWIPTKPNIVGITGPILADSSILMCAFGGVIKVNMPGQYTITI
ncbi:MAG: DUF4280 domain-containing protein [Alphaproteobacteria bacterium]|nr:DUF4280 domain-containing protein [Alphaproteobacteria bacterium]